VSELSDFCVFFEDDSTDLREIFFQSLGRKHLIITTHVEKQALSSIKDIYEKNSFLETTQKVEQLAHINVLKLDRKSHILLRMSHWPGFSVN